MLQVIAISRVNRRIEFDQDFTGLDTLTVADIDRPNYTRLERLDLLRPAAGNNLASRRCDDVHLTNKRPRESGAEYRHDGQCNRAAGGRSWSFDDLQRRRQEGELFPVATMQIGRKRDDFSKRLHEFP